MRLPFISGLVEKRVDEAIEQRSLAKFDEFLDFLVDGGQSNTGVHVNEKTALNSTAVFACVRILSETIASLPLPVYKRLEPRGKERANSHPLYKILHDAPNPYMTSFTFRETLQGHLGTWGNAYADIVWGGNGQVKELWPLRPDKMKEMKMVGGRLKYIYILPDKTETVLDYSRVLHVPGLGFDGYVGYSPISKSRDAVGLALATEKYGGNFFKNGARPGGVLRHPNKLSPEAKKGLEGSWAKMHQGLDNAHRVAILEEGMDYTQIGLPPEDAQFIEARKFQLEEIARIYRIPPHMLADLTHATFSNIEHQSIDFVVHTIRPWLVRWEQAIKQRLLNTNDRDGYFAEFLVDGLLRGDSESRNKAYAVGRQWGWLNANDILEMENKNPIGDQGDKYLVPMNMIDADKINDFEPKSTAPKQERQVEKRQQNQPAINRSILAARFTPVINDAYSRIVKRDVADVRRAVKRLLKDTKDPTDFLEWVEDYYEKAPEWISRTIEPVYRSFADMVAEQAASEVDLEKYDIDEFIRDYVDAFAGRYVIGSRSVIKALVRDNRSSRDVVDETDPGGAVIEQLDHWEETRAEGESQDEAVQISNAVAKFVFISAGITRLAWAALGSDSCEFCESLDGKIVGIEQNFAANNSTIEAGGNRLPIHGNKGHAPIHKGCVCQILPVF